MLYGRDADLKRTLELTAQHRLVTLTGPGGVGKTRLARAVQHAQPGATFVDFTAIASADHAAETVVRALGWSRPGTDPARILHARLPTCRHLIILDNLEHLQINGDIARHVRDWMTHAPALRLLVTSRVALNLPGEARLPLDGLGLPPRTAGPAELLASPAGRLFVNRARQARPGLTLDHETAADIAALCHQLDGLPLALELTASRMDLFTPGAALTWLRDGRLLPGTSTHGRHASVEAAAGWSYALLDPSVQRSFTHLGILGGHFGVDLAAAVLDLQPDTARAHLRELTEWGLLGRTDPRQPRYALLHTLQAAALHRLRAHGEEHQARWRHATHLHDTARQLAAALEDRGWHDAISLVQQELDQLRAALRWLTGHAPPDPEVTRLALGLATRLTRVWSTSALWHEGRRWLSLALARPGPPTPERVQATASAAILAMESGDGATAATLIDSALRHATHLNPPLDPRAQASLHNTRGTTLKLLRRLDDAHAAFQHARACLHRSPHDETYASLIVDLNLAEVRRMQGDPAGALRGFTLAARTARRHDLLQPAVHARECIADCLNDLGHPRTALRVLRPLEREARQAGMHTELTWILLAAATAHVLADDPEGAQRELDRADAHLKDHSEAPTAYHAEALTLRACCAERLGNLFRAREFAGTALGTYELLQDARAADATSALLANLDARSGRTMAALRALAGLLPRLQPEPHDAWAEIETYQTLALCAARLKDTHTVTLALAAAGARARHAPTAPRPDQRERLNGQLSRHTPVMREPAREELVHAARELLAKATADPLNEADLELARLLARGLTTPQLAHQLRKSPHTIRNRLTRLYRRYGVRDRQELLRDLHDRGLLGPSAPAPGVPAPPAPDDA